MRGAVEVPGTVDGVEVVVGMEVLEVDMVVVLAADELLDVLVSGGSDDGGE